MPLVRGVTARLPPLSEAPQLQLTGLLFSSGCQLWVCLLCGGTGVYIELAGARKDPRHLRSVQLAVDALRPVLLILARAFAVFYLGVCVGFKVVHVQHIVGQGLAPHLHGSQFGRSLFLGA